jgi:hypothetical protein
MKSEKWWAIVSENDLVDLVEAETREEAVKAYVEKAHVPEEDAKLLTAIDGENVRDDVWVPGWLISALEYGPEFAFGPQESSPDAWDDFWKAIAKLGERNIRIGDIVGWVRIRVADDFWVPVVK